MKLSFVLLSIVFLLFGNSKFKGGTHAIITGGYIPVNNGANFMVLLKTRSDDGVLFCGGAIISVNRFVTAAHCFHNVTKATVKLGSTHPYNQHALTFEIVHHIPHPYWRPGQHAYDVAVGVFPKPLEFGININRIQVVAEDDTVQEFLGVKAFGYAPTDYHPDRILRCTGLINVMHFGSCAYLYNKVQTTLDKNVQFCLGPKEDNINHIHKDDSGGPIVDLFTGELLGIIGGTVVGKPDVCLRIDAVRKFLENPDEYTG